MLLGNHRKSLLNTMLLVVVFVGALLIPRLAKAEEMLPEYDDPCLYVDPEFYDLCDAGRYGWYPCWSCAHWGVPPAYYLVKSCRGSVCDNLAQQGWSIEHSNLSSCRDDQGGETGTCVGPHCGG
jgi:hypothetical protein